MEKKLLDSGSKEIDTQGIADPKITEYGKMKDRQSKKKLENNSLPPKDSMTHLDWDVLKAANAGISYGKMKAAEAPPITVEIPKNLKKVVVKKLIKPTTMEPMTVAKLTQLLQKVATVFPDAEVRIAESKGTSGFHVCVVFQSNGTIWGMPKVVLHY